MIETNTRSRNGPPELDDWLAGDGGFDWPGEPVQDDAAVGFRRAEDLAPVRRTPTREEARRRPDAATFVRRRRILAVSALGVFIAAALAITLATAGGRGGEGASPPEAASTAAKASTPPVATPPASPQPSPPAVTTTKTETKASTTTVRVSLPAAGPLALGDDGQAVVKLQKALATLGFAVTADGDFGTATEDALKEFQDTNGLTADGVAGSATVQKLNEALAGT